MPPIRYKKYLVSLYSDTGMTTLAPFPLAAATQTYYMKPVHLFGMRAIKFYLLGTIVAGATNTIDFETYNDFPANSAINNSASTISLGTTATMIQGLNVPAAAQDPATGMEWAYVPGTSLAGTTGFFLADWMRLTFVVNLGVGAYTFLRLSMVPIYDDPTGLGQTILGDGMTNMQNPGLGQAWDGFRTAATKSYLT